MRSPMGRHHCEKKVSTASLTCGELKGGDFMVRAKGAMKDLHASFNRSCIIRKKGKSFGDRVAEAEEYT